MVDRELVAYHEAAQAVAYYALWRPFDYVTTAPDDDCVGHVQGMPFPPDPNCWFEGDYDALVGDVAVTSLAGPVAERACRCDITYEAGEIFNQLSSDDRATVDMALQHSSTAATKTAEGVLEYDVGTTLDELLRAYAGRPFRQVMMAHARWSIAR
jgi:hypothetical protein